VRGVQPLVERLGKQAKALRKKAAGNLIHQEAGLTQRFHCCLGCGHVLFQAGPRTAMIPESFHCSRRNRIDGVGTDQLLDVEHGAELRVLRARAGPEDTLGLVPLVRVTRDFLERIHQLCPF